MVCKYRIFILLNYLVHLLYQKHQRDSAEEAEQNTTKSDGCDFFGGNVACVIAWRYELLALNIKHSTKGIGGFH